MQVNPLAETRDGTLMAADAKLGFDDNAFFRQKELFSMRDESQEDARFDFHGLCGTCCMHFAVLLPPVATGAEDGLFS